MLRFIAVGTLASQPQRKHHQLTLSWAIGALHTPPHIVSHRLSLNSLSSSSCSRTSFSLESCLALSFLNELSMFGFEGWNQSAVSAKQLTLRPFCFCPVEWGISLSRDKNTDWPCAIKCSVLHSSSHVMCCHRPPFLLIWIFPFTCLRQARRDSISFQRRKERINNSTLAPEAWHTPLHFHIPAPYRLPSLTCLRLSSKGLVLFYPVTIDALHNIRNKTHIKIWIFRYLFGEFIHRSRLVLIQILVSEIPQVQLKMLESESVSTQVYAVIWYHIIYSLEMRPGSIPAALT